MTEPLQAVPDISSSPEPWRGLVDAVTDVQLSARQLPDGAFEDLVRQITAQLRPWVGQLAMLATRSQLSAGPADAVSRAFADQLIGLIVHATGRGEHWKPAFEPPELDTTKEYL